MTGVDFADYLDAKYEIDSRSLRNRVRRSFLSRFRSIREPSVLDVGCGAGATIRRLLEVRHSGAFRVTALDADAELLRLAEIRTTEAVERRDLVPPAPGAVTVRFIQGDILEALHLFGAAGFDVVIAHAVLDLLPLEGVCGVLRALLRPRGILYATLNYDGLTRLLPRYTDPSLEDRILDLYDSSMDERRVKGQATGGSRTGSSLPAAVESAGMEILDLGCSDWQVYPRRRSYAPGEEVLIRAMLGFIRNEIARSGGVSRQDLRRWYEDRHRRLDEGSLGLFVHHVDVLARRPGR